MPRAGFCCIPVKLLGVSLSHSQLDFKPHGTELERMLGYSSLPGATEIPRMWDSRFKTGALGPWVLRLSKLGPECKLMGGFNLIAVFRGPCLDAESSPSNLWEQDTPAPSRLAGCRTMAAPPPEVRA